MFKSLGFYTMLLTCYIQTDLQQADQLEGHDLPSNVFRAVVENASHLYGEGNTDLIEEICSNDTLANVIYNFLIFFFFLSSVPLCTTKSVCCRNSWKCYSVTYIYDANQSPGHPMTNHKSCIGSLSIL